MTPEEQATSEHPDLEDEQIPPLSTGKTLGYSIAEFGQGTFFALNNAVMNLLLDKYTHNAIILSLMSNSDSIEGVIVQPAVGSISDRLRSPFGRRRVFMLAAIPLSALFIVLTPLAANLPVTVRLGAMIAFTILFTTLFNISRSPYQALLADITPPRQRGRVTSIWTLFGVLGQATLLIAPISIDMKFFLCAALMIATMLITCAAIKEPPLTDPPPRHHPWQEIRVAMQGLRTLAQAKKAILVIFWAGVGIGSVLPLLTEFVKMTTKCSDQQALNMFLVLMIATAVSVLPFGRVIDTWGAKRVLMLGSGLIVVAAIAAFWATTLAQITVILVIAGMGNAAQSAARFPLLTALVPHKEVGFYTGLQGTAQSIAAPLTAIITGYLANTGGYRWIFVVCAICLVISMMVLAAVQLPAAKEEIRRRELEREN